MIHRLMLLLFHGDSLTPDAIHRLHWTPQKTLAGLSLEWYRQQELKAVSRWVKETTGAHDVRRVQLTIAADDLRTSPVYVPVYIFRSHHFGAHALWLHFLSYQVQFRDLRDRPWLLPFDLDLSISCLRFGQDVRRFCAATMAALSDYAAFKGKRSALCSSRLLPEAHWLRRGCPHGAPSGARTCVSGKRVGPMCGAASASATWVLRPCLASCRPQGRSCTRSCPAAFGKP